MKEVIRASLAQAGIEQEHIPLPMSVTKSPIRSTSVPYKLAKAKTGVGLPTSSPQGQPIRWNSISPSKHAGGRQDSGGSDIKRRRSVTFAEEDKDGAGDQPKKKLVTTPRNPTSRSTFRITVRPHDSGYSSSASSDDSETDNHSEGGMVASDAKSTEISEIPDKSVPAQTTGNDSSTSRDPKFMSWEHKQPDMASQIPSNPVINSFGSKSSSMGGRSSFN